MIAEGQVLDGTYRLLRLVGEGGMGVVYEATHARLAGRYAIKVLLQNLADNGAALTQFDREARITSSLQHPNIVQVIDHNTTADGTSYLVMEFLAGESLADRLARTGRLGLAAVVDIVDEIAAGLAAAHAHGIVHRDLKPDNVFLVPVEGRQRELVKILDFGISRAGSWIHAVERYFSGTPHCMSPEQLQGGGGLAAASDQFALAVIAYELLTGRNPFKGDALDETFARVAATDPAPTGVSPAVDAVLARGFAKAKGRRFSSVTELAAALRAAARETPRPLTTPTYVTGQRVVRGGIGLKPGRRGGGWAVGAAVVGSVVAVLCFGENNEARLFSRPATAGMAPDRSDAGAPPAEAPMVDAIDSADGFVSTSPSRTLRVSAPARSRARGRQLRPARASASAPPRVTSALPADDDATLPPSIQ